MPLTRRRKAPEQHPPSGTNGLHGEVYGGRSFESLVTHCFEAHAIIKQHGTPAMLRLVELLLFEIASESVEDHLQPRDLN